MMRRREFITLLGGAAAAWPLVARAQQLDQARRIGVLMGYPENDPEAQAYFAAFRDGLRKLGWTEDRNIRIDHRWITPGDTDSLQRFAKELVALQPDVILSNTTPTTAALLQQTRTIPIIFTMVADPLGSGFVASFSKPGGNVTGFTTIEGSLGGKWVELLRETAPRVVRTALLFNPASAPFFEYYLKTFNAAAASFGMEAITAPVRDMPGLESVVAALARENGGLVVLNEDFTIAHRAEIISLAARYRLPAVYPYRFFAELGGLLSYGVNLSDNFRRAAPYADRILKGEKPADLPVQAPPTKYELVINLKTAKALGLTVPPSLLTTADEVIE